MRIGLLNLYVYMSRSKLTATPREDTSGAFVLIFQDQDIWTTYKKPSCPNIMISKSTGGM